MKHVPSRVHLVLLVALMCLSLTGCDLIEKYKNMQKGKAGSGVDAQQQIEGLQDDLTKLQAEKLQLDAKYAELAKEFELCKFRREEYDRNFQRYQELELTNDVLEQRVEELRKQLNARDKEMRELELKLEAAATPVKVIEPPLALFRQDSCVQWYGSMYKSRHKMTGRVIKVKPNFTYLVECTHSTMPYSWSEGQLYELKEEILEPCSKDTQAPGSDESSL